MNVLIRRITSNRRVLQTINSSLRFPSIQWYYQPCSEVLNSRSVTNTPTTKDLQFNQDSLCDGGSKLTETASQPSHWRHFTLANLSLVLEYLKFEVKSQSEATSDEVERMMRARGIVNQSLLGITKKDFSLKEIEEAMEVMRLLKDRGIYANFHKGVATLVRQVLRVLIKEGDAVEDKVKMEVLSLCSKLRYRIHELSSSDREDVKVLLQGIKIDYISESLSRYGDYFFLLASLDISWKDLSQEWRKKLLSCMRSFGELTKEGLPGAERLVSGVETLLILKTHLGEMEDADKRWYELMLNKLLAQKYGWRTMSNDENKGGLAITPALLFQLRTLPRDEGRTYLTARQLELIYTGLGQEWNRQEMQVHSQCLTFLSLGDLCINYRSVPADLWKTMLEGLSKNIKQKGIKATKVSELLKGWRGMEVKWKVLESELQEVVMETVAGLNEDGKSPRALANSVLYLGDLGVSWQLHVSEERKKRILLKIVKALENCNAQEFSNTLLGLGKMGFKMEKTHNDLQKQIWTTIESKSGEMNYQGISNTIYSLANLGVKWKFIPQKAKTALEIGVNSTYTEMDERSMNGLFYGLSNMGVIATDLPPVMRELLETCITRLAKMDYREHKIGAIFLSFAKMGFVWKNLNKTTQEALVKMILTSAKDFNSQDLANTMYSVTRVMRDDPKVMKQHYFLPILLLLRSRETEIRKVRTFYGDEEETQVSMFYTWVEKLPATISQKVIIPKSPTAIRRIPILKMF